ncbi:MAG TPA: hypothetical protein V6D30_20360 [Leptolyngbyaceae cyanobacterium]
MDKAQNNELDEQLKQLAISAQQHPPLLHCLKHATSNRFSE